MDRDEKDKAIGSLISLVLYCVVAWIASEAFGIAFTKTLGAMLAARFFFEIVEGLAGIIDWQLFGKRKTVKGLLDVLRSNQFPQRFDRYGDFETYLDSIEDDPKCSDTIKQYARDFKSLLLFAEHQGTLARMRMRKAGELALEAYSPLANVPSPPRPSTTPSDLDAPFVGKNIKPGSFARVVYGPCTGAVVRCINKVYAPPATPAMSLPQPLWRVDSDLRWADPRTGYEFTCAAAPENALVSLDSPNTHLTGE